MPPTVILQSNCGHLCKLRRLAGKYPSLIPLSNTNQLWGLLWGILVFDELHGRTRAVFAQVIGGSLLMAVGAVAIAFSSATEGKYSSWKEAAQRESDLYNIEPAYVAARMEGKEINVKNHARAWIDWLLIGGAILILAAFGSGQHSRKCRSTGAGSRSRQRCCWSWWPEELLFGVSDGSIRCALRKTESISRGF